MKGYFYKVGWFALFFFFFALPSLANAEKYVIIDPGHGGWASGTVGFSDRKVEKEVNLEQALKLKKVLEETTDIEVFMTRTTDTDWGYEYDLGADLGARMEEANGYAAGNNESSVFISIHHNAMPSAPLYRGYETYYFNWNYPDSRWPADPMQMYFSPESKRLAHTIHPAVLEGTPLTEGRGIIHNHLFVTRNAQMPSVLVELGYATNPTEERMIESDEFQWKAARALAKGIEEFFDAYKVYDYQGERLAVFKSESKAIDYVKAHSNAKYVFDMETQRKVFVNRGYGVYGKSGSSEDKVFRTKDDALKYAKSQQNTRVVNNETGEILWSDYLNKIYVVKNSSNKVLLNAYQENQAVDYAQDHQNTSVVNTETGRVIWSNYIPKKFKAYYGDKKLLNAFYDKDAAIDYAKTWMNTKVVNGQTDKVVWQNDQNGQKDHIYSFSDQVLRGDNRMLTAIAVSKHLYPDGFSKDKNQKVVVLTCALEFADALSAAPLAAQYGNAPILLTTGDELYSPVLKEINRLNAQKVVILGGPGAVSNSIKNKIESHGFQTQRIYGDTRIKTDLAINSHLNDVNGVLVANGYRFADALSASSIAAINNWAIVLTQKDQISQASLDFLEGKQVAIVGGDGVVSNSVENQIVNQNGADQVVRLSGDNRYKTLAEVINYFKDDLHSNTVIAATGQKFPDALTASSLSARTSSPLFLFYNKIDMSKSIGTQLSKYGEHNAVSHLNVVGGVLDGNVIQEIDQKLH